LEGTLRYLYDEKVFADENIVKKIEKIINETCSMHGADYEFIFKKKNKAVLNDQKMTDLINLVSKSVLSIKKVIPYICTASEDFSEFSSKVPSVFYFLGAGNKGKKTNFPHHNSYFNIDEDVLASGVELHVRSALNFFDQYKTFR
jgi:amidohydrolase